MKGGNQPFKNSVVLDFYLSEKRELQKERNAAFLPSGLFTEKEKSGKREIYIYIFLKLNSFRATGVQGA